MPKGGTPPPPPPALRNTHKPAAKAGALGEPPSEHIKALVSLRTQAGAMVKPTSRACRASKAVMRASYAASMSVLSCIRRSYLALSTVNSSWNFSSTWATPNNGAPHSSNKAKCGIERHRYAMHALEAEGYRTVCAHATLHEGHTRRQTTQYGA